MRFVATKLAGAFVLELEPHVDARGMFARTFCRRELEGRGLVGHVEQSSLSVTTRKGTLRGLHYQAPPHQEVKVVRCVRGAVYDVIVDLRRTSSTYLAWDAFTLTAEARTALYIPADFAHGFLTLTDGAEVLYQMSTAYQADAALGLRWDDPGLAIHWPAAPVLVAERDAGYPLLAERGGGE